MSVTAIKEGLIDISERFLLSRWLMRVRLRLYGKWSEQGTDGVRVVRASSGQQAQISGLLRILSTREPKVRPILVHRSEDSVLDRPGSESIPRKMAGGRPRLATCTGTCWIDDRHLVVANFHGQHVRVYRYREDGLELLHHQDHSFAPPEDVAVSPDGRLMAVTHTMPGEDMVSLHQLEPESLKPGPILAKFGRGCCPHGLTFSADSRFVLVTEIMTGSVLVYRLDGARVRRVQTFRPPLAPRVPKSVAVTADGRYVAVAHSAEVALGREQLTGARLAIHRFDAQSGRIEEAALAVQEGYAQGLAGLESCTFVRREADGSYLFSACDQATDLLAFFRFQEAPPRLDRVFAASGVSFPHGVGAHPQGELLAVACYGDDTLRIFQVPSLSTLVAPDPRPHLLVADDGFSLPEADLKGLRLTGLVSNETSGEALASVCDCVVLMNFQENAVCEANLARLSNFLREEKVNAVIGVSPAGNTAVEAAQRLGLAAVLNPTEGERKAFLASLSS